MKLVEFRVQMFKGVIDSGLIGVEHLTTLVGKNESGKTTLLKALHKLNPATPEPYVMEREWPRGRRRERRDDQVVCTAKFTLNEEQRRDLARMTDQKGDPVDVEVSRDYGGRLEVVFSPGLFPDKLHPNQVDAECEAILNIPAGVGEAFKKTAQECQDEARRISHEGRFGELTSLHAKHSAVLQGGRSADGQAEHQAEQPYVDQYLAWLQQLPKKLPTLPSIQKQAHEYVVQRLPKFIYMDDFRVFQGKAILNQVKERRAKGKVQPDDSTFLMILKLAGLDLDDLVTKGNSDDREQRQYDLDDGARTLSALFKDRLKQREYAVEFRADGQEFYTLVKDGTDVGLIRLEERSKGFQWFFSFDLLFMHESEGNFENCVLLLDEPGLHLHPGAQQDLLIRLQEYAKGNTLIYSTHLPFMLNLKHPERIRVINEGPTGT